MIKVFFKDKALRIGSEPCGSGLYPFALNLRGDLDSLRSVMDLDIEGACWQTNEPEFALDKLKFHCLYVQAAGGVIFHEQKFLGILRHNVWDLPKGKRDEGETIEMTAIREIREETGLVVTDPGFLCTTFHTYADFSEPERLVLKETYWYKFEMKGEQQISLQAEESITQYNWFDRGDTGPFKRNTYASLIEVIALI